MQVVAALREEIRAGRLESGDKLPSVRKLAEQYGVAAMTAQNALRTMHGQGLIYAVPGRGNYVSQDAATLLKGTNSQHDPEGCAQLAREVEQMTARLQEVEARLASLEERVDRTEHDHEDAATR